MALKILPEEFAADGERAKRFEREARAVAATNHPNIVTVYSVEESEGTRFITMEFVEGDCLGDLIPPGGLALPKLLDMMIPLADAIGVAM